MTFIQYILLDCREVIRSFELWDQVRVDCGREWYLMLYVNQSLAHLRYDTAKNPHLQTTSKKYCYRNRNMSLLFL